MTHTAISGKTLATCTHFSISYNETTLTHHHGAEERLRKKNKTVTNLNLDIT